VWRNDNTASLTILFFPLQILPAMSQPLKIKLRDKKKMFAVPKF
jgi:hypothetical protein